MPAKRPEGRPDPTLAPKVGLLAYLVPGLGHFYLGERTRGIIFCAVITVTFWCGVAIGGVRTTVDTQQRRAWFIAQLCAGANTLAIVGVQKVFEERFKSLPKAYWPAEDIAVVYTGVAGLLNLLVILDALVRAEKGVRVPIPVPHGREPPERRAR